MPKNRNANFPFFRFGRFGIPFGSIDIASEGRGGPPWKVDQLDAPLFRALARAAEQCVA